MENKVVFILGPTAVGKSEVAIRIAKKFNGEIISADSVQIFKGLDIGSAKITHKEMGGIVHYGIDICQPDETFTAFQFVQYTLSKIKEISARGHLPIVVGGTGLYIRALTEGYNFGGTGVDKDFRARLEKIQKEEGCEKLFEILQQLSPEMTNGIDRKNPVRLIRAIEIAHQNGQKRQHKPEITSLVLALSLPRELLYERINKRVDEMLSKGLVDEVKALLSKGLSAENQSMHAIGYKEILQFLNGEIAFEQAVSLVKQHSRNYAKRQMTFTRGMNCDIIDMQDKIAGLENIEKTVNSFLR